MRLLLSAVAATALCLPLPRTSAAGLPDGATTLFPAAETEASDAFDLGGAQVELGELTRIDTDRGPALRAEAAEAAGARWNLQLLAKLPAALQAGDTLLLRFDARCLDSSTGEGVLQAKIERDAVPWTEVVSRGASFGPEWKHFDFPFEVPAGDFPAGNTQLTFHLGAQRQAVEVANIEVLRFPEAVAVDDLPATRSTYAGREADAPWRAEAAERIDRLRKGDLTVTVVDASGEPVEGVSVAVRQLSHAFPFGSAINLNRLTRGGPEAKTYEEKFLERFNAVVFENGLKWRDPERTDLIAAEAGVAFAEEHDLFLRGHTLVWPGVRHLPDFVVEKVEHLKANPNDADARADLRAIVEERVSGTVARYAGRIDAWDVANEVFANHDLLDVLDPEGTPAGHGVLADLFRVARAADPKSRLVLNDYGVLTAASPTDTHAAAYFQLASELLEADAPLDGLGVQGHFGSGVTPPEMLWEHLDRLATLGLPVTATEFDINSDDAELKADYTRDFHTALFAHPAVDGILSWGFWASQHWRPDAAYLNPDFSSRASDLALRRLIQQEWWTDEALDTDGDGVASTRAFQGTHAVTVTGPDGTATRSEVTVGSDGGALQVTLGGGER